MEFAYVILIRLKLNINLTRRDNVLIIILCKMIRKNMYKKCLNINYIYIFDKIIQIIALRKYFQYLFYSNAFFTLSMLNLL